VTDGGRFGGANVTVPLPGGCQCPGTPHAQDEVYLLPRLTFDGGAAAEAVLERAIGGGDAEAIAVPLMHAYLEHQVVGWNLTDAAGAPLPYTRDLLVRDWESARIVADKADDLYSGALLAPLLAAASQSSPGGPTAASTSARTPTASRRRKP
jgi:hypothetical protein